MAAPSTDLSRERWSTDRATRADSRPEAAADAAEAAEAGDRGDHHRGPVPQATTTLPARPIGFTGRDADLARVREALSPTTPGAPVLISAVTGMGGIGKTALVVYAAHEMLYAFPGGTLFVDLRGYDDHPATAEQTLLALLEALGVRGTDLPRSAEAQLSMYRDLMAQRRRAMLLILDNASDSSQVAKLLPSNGCHRVLITSRDRMDSLPVRTFALGTLSPRDAIALLRAALEARDDTDERASREPEALRELAALCGHLPLALQIAAALLARRRHREISSLVADLRTSNRVDALRSQGVDQYDKPLVLQPVFEASYRRLSDGEARLLRLLGAAPGTETSTDAAAAMAGLSPDETVALLEELAATHLVAEVRAAHGPRWRLHSLVREFAAGPCGGDDEVGDARERLLGFYRRWAGAADDHLRALPGDPMPRRFAGRGAALAWLDSERANLVAAVQWAEEDRFAEDAVQLSLRLAEYLDWRRHFGDKVMVCRVAQTAAARSDDRDSEAKVWNNLGSALRMVGKASEAVEALTRARDIHRHTGDRDNEGIAWNNLGNALLADGQTAKAVEAHTEARRIHESTGDRNREAMAWNNLGIALLAGGQTAAAIDAVTRARDIHQHTGDRNNEGHAWNNLGLVLRAVGRTPEAIEAFDRSVEINEGAENWYGMGQSLSELAHAHEVAGDSAAARAACLRAAEAYDRARATPEATEARRRAAELQPFA
ncbi:tetratricopeptide repeat protein [Streptomyces sp. E11-3]|uniref:ATP-binding protein n=1 Tax=Streptomyces sp. E11-3 TaxID=3110112 RepID=UPI003980E7D4